MAVRDVGGHDDRPPVTVEQSEQRFQLLVDSVLDYAIYLLDRDGHVASWNSGAQRLKGYTANEILGRHYSTFYPPEAREAGLPATLLEQARSHGRVLTSGWRVRKDGTRFWADVVITALFEDGRITGFAKVTRDMTETHRLEQEREQALADQRRAVEALEELHRWRRDFAGAIAHDLKNPVITITAFAELLLEDLPPDAEQARDFAERIRSNASSLYQLIEHLRTHTQLETGRIEIAPEEVELDGFVSGLLADMGPVLAHHRVESDVGEVVVAADRRGLERILRNLLTNAARHTPPGHRIRVSAHGVDDGVMLEVADEGEGVPPDLLPRVFDRFERGAHGGTGLGLSIVRQYVELHGGEVSATSTPGQGARFRFTLPGA